MLSAYLLIALAAPEKWHGYDEFKKQWPKQIKTVQREVRGVGSVLEWGTERTIPRVLTVIEERPTGSSPLSVQLREEMASRTRDFISKYRSEPRSDNDYLTQFVGPYFIGHSHCTIVQRRHDNTTGANSYGWNVINFLLSNGKLNKIGLGAILLPGAVGSLEKLLLVRAGLQDEDEVDRLEHGWQASSDFWSFARSGLYFIANGYRHQCAYFLNWQDLKPYLNLESEAMRLPITADGRSVRQVLTPAEKQPVKPQWAKITTASLAKPTLLPWPFDFVEMPVSESEIKKIGFTKGGDGSWYGRAEPDFFLSEDEKLASVLGDLRLKLLKPIGFEVQLTPRNSTARSVVLNDTLNPKQLVVTLNRDLTVDLWVDFPRRADSDYNFALMQYRWDGKRFRRLRQWTGRDFNLKFLMGVNFFDMDEDGSKELIVVGSNTDDSASDRSHFYRLLTGTPTQFGRIEGHRAGGISMEAGWFESRLTMLDASGGIITILDEYQMPNQRYGSHIYRVTNSGAERVATTKSTITAQLPGPQGKAPIFLGNQIDFYGDSPSDSTPYFLWEFRPR